MAKPKSKLQRKRLIPPSIMAIFVAVLFALTWIAVASAQMSRTETIKQAEMSKVSSPETKPVTEPEKAPEPKPVEATPEPPKVDPNGCEAQGMWYRADNNECIPKPAETAAAPASVAVASSGSGDCSLVNNYDWPRATAMRVCMQESGGNPNNKNLNDWHSFANCRGSFGLMQINCSHGEVYNGAQNMAIAYAMWSGAGGSFWQDWPNTCRKVGC